MKDTQFEEWLLDLKNTIIAALIAALIGIVVMIGIYFLLPPELQENFIQLLRWT